MDIKLKIPVAGIYAISFRFGENPPWYVKQFGEPHNGVDFAVELNTPVLAADNGRVIFSDTIPDANGMGLIISHDYGWTLYWHLNKIFAKVGDVVSKGDLIGLSGMTGFATGPHLHFGLKLNNPKGYNIRGYVDPMPYFEEKELNYPPSSSEKRYHIVKPGDTLWGLAVKYYGNGCLWPKIYNANKDQIKNPNLIRVFQRLLIP